MRNLIRMIGNSWLGVTCTCAALLLWAQAASHGYAWQMIWLPASVAGAASAHHGKRTLEHCRRRLRRQSKRPA
jgi:hypothetical protein